MKEKVAEEFFQSLERPLRYVENGDEKRLQAVKNLSQHVCEVCQLALASRLEPSFENLFRSILLLFQSFDQTEIEQKKSIIREALQIMKEKKGESSSSLFVAQEHQIPSFEILKKSHETLSREVKFVKGVGPVLASKFNKANIWTLHDLLLFFPFRYEDRRQFTSIKDLKEGQSATVIGQVIFSGVAFYRGLRRRVFEVVIEDETGELKLKWFHFSLGSLEDKFNRGQRVFVCGKPARYRSHLEMHHPDVEVFSGKEDSLSFGKIVPIYREIGGMYQKTLRKILHQAVEKFSQDCLCVLPPSICQRFQFQPPWKVLRFLHQPREWIDELQSKELQKVLAFEELFFYCLSLILRKKTLSQKLGISFDRECPRLQRLKETLPFTLTHAQEMVWTSLRKDMAAPRPMNRLLEGDVGSGKTILAIMASMVAIDHGFQVAFMAPTEILAEQHFRTLSAWIKPLEFQVGLLLGRHPVAARKKCLEEMASGKIQVVIGTHALLERDVAFQNLGLVIVDEQHRFGVRQRAEIRSKALEPDVLVMSATPIPRTLALTLYADLDVSILNEMPPGRQKVDTLVYAEKDRVQVYENVRRAVQSGQQAFIVYPLVEASEKIPAKDATSMAQVFEKNIFPEFRVALIHGQMPSLQKEETMNRFQNHEIDILVSTTVIEVGIDVPRATIMVIEHPERFGLSQLHQLRGRVGRGQEKSFCFVIYSPNISETAKHRLRIFSKNHDGFLLAEEDLKNRGSGDLFGVEQSGYPKFSVAIFPRDFDLLEAARREAFSILEKDPGLQETSHRHLRWYLEEVWKDRLNLVRIG